MLKVLMAPNGTAKLTIPMHPARPDVAQSFREAPGTKESYKTSRYPIIL